MLLRQQEALDRAIDRKVRILLAMRKESERGWGGSPTAPTEAQAGPPGEEPPGHAAGEVAPTLSSAEADPAQRSRQTLKVNATTPRTDSPTDENGAPTPKSPEQSQNVIENKEQATEEIAA